MKKILVVGPSPTKSKGGMATVISEIQSSEKLKEEFEIEVFESYVDGVRLKRLVYSVYAFLKFFFLKRKYDIYHIHAASRGSTFRKGYYVRAAKRWGKKVIFHIHGAQYLEFYRELSSKKKTQVVDILNSADIVIALSEEWKREFETIFGIKNCVVLNNGIDTAALKNGYTPPAMNANAFLMLGRQGKRKGSYDLLDAVQIAVKTNPNIIVYLAGDGDVEQIKNIVIERNLGKNIKVVGWVDFNGKIEYLRKVSTSVLPSYNEGLPMSILEGMAAGKAIIGTTVGAVPEVIKEENGLLITPGNIDMLASALIKLSTDVNLITKMSEKNMEKAEKDFSMETMHKKLISIYNAVSFSLEEGQ